MRCWLQTF